MTQLCIPYTLPCGHYTVIAEGIRKAFGDHVVLDGVDLQVEAGTVFALLGPNGAGKTTVINILSTLLRPDAGKATVAGHDLEGDAEGVRRSISVTGQSVALDEVLTVEENLIMMARLRRLGMREARARAGELVAEFDLAEIRERRVKECSGGMRRRVDLAISLIHRPPLIFLDEPTTGLDPASREQVWASIRDLVASGTTVFLTTQYLEEADRLADRIAMLNNGQIVAEGTADMLKSSLSGELVRLEFIDETSRGRAAALLGVAASDEHLEIATDGSAEAIRVLLTTLEREGVPAQKLALHRPSLDDVFFSVTSSDRANAGAR
ncbi:MAG TPA: ATP-binding cassette domain-containing protein [Acidimicrobiia bacterium]|nr:ATP-binding cassette domain-containing protein [Acidimicrobiia bacterium]